MDRWHEEDRGFETPCWVWDGGTSGGYPTQSRRPHAVHRAVYQHHHNIRLPSSVHVHHRCGVKLCVRPDHLEAKTRAEHGAAHTGHVGRAPGPRPGHHPIPWRASRAAQAQED